MQIIFCFFVFLNTAILSEQTHKNHVYLHSRINGGTPYTSRQRHQNSLSTTNHPRKHVLHGSLRGCGVCFLSISRPCAENFAHSLSKPSTRLLHYGKVKAKKKKRTKSKRKICFRPCMSVLYSPPYKSPLRTERDRHQTDGNI